MAFTPLQLAEHSREAKEKSILVIRGLLGLLGLLTGGLE